MIKIINESLDQSEVQKVKDMIKTLGYYSPAIKKLADLGSFDEGNYSCENIIIGKSLSIYNDKLSNEEYYILSSFAKKLCEESGCRTGSFCYADGIAYIPGGLYRLSTLRDDYLALYKER